MDGTSMPTIGEAPTAPAGASSSSMSSHTDSIISLPPLGSRASRWNNLQSAVPPRLRRERGGSLGGRDLAKLTQNRERRRIPQQTSPGPLQATANEQKPNDVRIDLCPVVPPPAAAVPPTQNASRHKRRPSRSFADGQLDNEGDQISIRDGNSKHVNYGALGGVSSGGGSSAIAPGYSTRDDDEWSNGNSSHNGSVGRRFHRRLGRSRRLPKNMGMEESHWDWKFPGTEDALMPSMAWVYLPLIGWLIFVIACTVNYSEKYLRKYAIDPFYYYSVANWGSTTGLFALCGVRSIAIVLSYIAVVKLAPLYGPGSGIPEMKCVLTGVFMPNVLSLHTLGGKMIGLSLSIASGLSVGRLGPFMHMSGIVASLVSKIPLFKALNTNPIFKLQALSAAMAAGVGATFGAPIGGAMLSIELMSAYYYIHWLPMSLFCSVMGYYLVALFIETDDHVFFNPDSVLSLHGNSALFIFVYSLLGIVCGLVGYCLIRFTIFMKRTIGHFFPSSEPRRVVLLLVAFVCMHTVVTNIVGGVLDLPQKRGVEELFGTPAHESSYGWLNAKLQLWENSWGSSLALFVIMSIKFLLTGISLVLPIPAGTFMPIFEIGAFLGRGFGELTRGLPILGWIDPRATAIVGAASLTSGTLHVTSIAIIMLELTREAVNVLPITISVIVAYAVSKSLSSDLFSELIKFRRLPYILGLREQYPKETRTFHEDVANIVAKTFMTRKYPHVTPRTTCGELRSLLSEPWEVVAFLNDEKDKKLYGVIKRRSLVSVLGLMDAADAQVEARRRANATESACSSSSAVPNRRDSLKDEPIVFLREFEPKHGHPLVDSGVMQVSVHTPFWKVITYFRMLSMNRIFVMTTNGSVAGMITKPKVVQYCFDIEQQAKSRNAEELEKAREQRKGEAEAQKKYGGSLRVNRQMAREMSTSNLYSMDGRRSRNASIQLS